MADLITFDYVRGFFDGEGNVQYGNINATNTDWRLLERIRDFLRERGIDSAIALQKPYRKSHRSAYRLVMTGADDLLRYGANIGFYERQKRARLSRMIYDLYCKPGKRFNLQQHDLARRLRSQGVSWREVARRVKLSTMTVHQRFARGNWPIDEDLYQCAKKFQTVPRKAPTLRSSRVRVAKTP